MKTLSSLSVFLFAVCSLVQGEEKDQKLLEMDVSIALEHYKMLSDKVTNHAGWPKEYFEGYPQCVTLEKEVNRLEDVTELLNDRPQKFKDKDVVVKILERDGFYIVSLNFSSYGKEAAQDGSHLVKAYVIKKGTKTLFSWIHW